MIIITGFGEMEKDCVCWCSAKVAELNSFQGFFASFFSFYFFDQQRRTGWSFLFPLSCSEECKTTLPTMQSIVMKYHCWPYLRGPRSNSNVSEMIPGRGPASPPPSLIPACARQCCVVARTWAMTEQGERCWVEIAALRWILATVSRCITILPELMVRYTL